ncbi:hypothetical protein D7V97_03225 [Corallococcus sp. CA053C]|uniref:LamG-like jellyroll fold domain-containing protein n=1 Tax=Corallococcus sp. CA053C TaxID=2316732 RepID=UPI000EC5B6EF|nr:LamG-like jellyroll fold domain-containing protein [Corallococcus sp. CA053C]RKH14441.1 hypothetical protein D7V97_03225 [Corallococcus sp. CA053C]
MLGGCLLLSSLPAAASDWFADDFETGTLVVEDSPAGRWDDAVPFSPNTLASGTAGAHRGRYGFTVVDRDSVSGSQASINVVRASLTSEFHMRSWLRMRAVGTTGNVVLMQGLPMLVELRLVLLPGLRWELAARSGSGRTYVSLHGSDVAADRWYLVEFGIRGLGTTSGEARLWVDGIEQGTALSGQDFRGAANMVEQVMVGEPWSDTGTFTGSFDFDDVRVSAAPMASRLELQRPVAASGSSGCLAVEVSLRSSENGTLAPSPYDAEVALAVNGGAGDFHEDADCDSPVARVVLPKGGSERRVYFHPKDSGGTVTLTASHGDFLPASLSVDPANVLPGDGDEDGGGPWTCSSAPGAFGGLPLLLGAWLWRAHRRRAR